MASPKARLISLMAAGLLLWVGAALFPLQALMVPAWHDQLIVAPRWPWADIEEHPILLCVSDFEVVSPGVLSFQVEERAPFLDSEVPYLGDVVGKSIVVPATEFVLSRSHEFCSRAS